MFNRPDAFQHGALPWNLEGGCDDDRCFENITTRDNPWSSDSIVRRSDAVPHDQELKARWFVEPLNTRI